MSDSDPNTLPTMRSRGGGRREGAAGRMGQGRQEGQNKVRGQWASEEVKGEQESRR